MSATRQHRTIRSLARPSASGSGARRAENLPLLQVDPELADGLTAQERSQAESLLVTRVLGLPTGTWETPANVPAQAYGLLLIDGLLGHRVRLGRGVALELLGPGDILRPWEPAPFSMLSAEGDWLVLEPARLAVLDARVTALAGRWPQLTINLSGRLIRRSQALGYMLAVSHMLRVEDRVLAILWHLASAWGRVTAAGVKVPFSLTHATLGQIVGAQRPSVTAALSLLQREGRLQRHEGGFTLLDEPPGVATAAAPTAAAV